MLEADVEVDRRDFVVRARLRVAPGERVALYGPSGAGKTTMLEAIAGIVLPRRARITLAGRVLTDTAKPVIALPPWQRGVGLLRQDPGLFPHLSVRDNLLYSRPGAGGRPGPSGAGGRPEASGAGGRPGASGAEGRPGVTGAAGRSGAADEFAELTEVLGINGLLSAMPAGLSGGQGHRVALGRLLLSHCDAMLLDEPYTGLDAGLRRTLTDLVVSLVGQRQIPAILVAHELAEAQAFADRLAVLDRGQVLQAGAPDEVVLRPATRRVAELVGYGGFVPVPGPAGEPGLASGETGADAQAQVAGIHPDRVIAGRHPDRGLVLDGVVTGCRPAGALWEITVAATGAILSARLPEPAPVGQQLELTAVDPPRFCPDGTASRAGGAARDAVSDESGADWARARR